MLLLRKNETLIFFFFGIDIKRVCDYDPSVQTGSKSNFTVEKNGSRSELNDITIGNDKIYGSIE